ncbi:hypothetical protein [uncultured Plantibacter sp.]|uniref:hypothetical protein n=1 Tax=uncultured Plantibacter sp. TaxID=293337 RepID=UPI0028D4123E|nr:hypothetical protein [uncultured Plantibacter sp.]
MKRPVTTAVLAAVLLAGVSALTACTFGSGDETPSGSATSIAPGVVPTDKGSDTTPTPPPADAVVSYAGVDFDGLHASAAGYVQGIIENGGSCTFTFTGLGEPIVVTSEGIADSSTTSCGTVQVPLEQLPSGTWSVTLTYSSDEIDKLSSTALDLEVP